ncbi:preprotein translocase subunit SecG [Sphingomicrobium sp. B8]|uniref:Protein-export membrane protein SecG n=1 Tax=Sphingomicrobium clamense TaxID=2851013 RepID=A0ABS6V5U4_9SPHN|nr:preprotein translocase subunit SecG [Sphingomicrobium sp. B8]MBW0144947.1 preprotein translocase subunit SecG [Sphingomicrobium sp. B8]
MFTFLLIVQTLVALALVSVILMQRSEGGGLGVGGSSSGLMTARGAADLLTRSTAILATIFVGLSITLAAVASTRGDTQTIDTSLVGETAPTQQTAPQPAPAEPVDENGVPLAQ